MNHLLAPTYYFNHNSEAIQAYIKQLKIPTDITNIEKAILLNNSIRDYWFYNPYKLHFKANECRASEIIKRTEGHCLDKATLLITCSRAIGIPARLQLAKVKNHIAVDHIAKVFRLEELTPHGYVALYH